MFDLKIERLKLNLVNAAGHEHRLQPITLRAVALLAERLDGPRNIRARHLDSLNAEALDMNLNEMSDEQAAEGIATAWADALSAQPDGRN